MLQITPQMKILVAVEPVDFRKGIDGLVRLCKESLKRDPFGGAVFAFRNVDSMVDPSRNEVGSMKKWFAASAVVGALPIVATIAMFLFSFVMANQKRAWEEFEVELSYVAKLAIRVSDLWVMYWFLSLPLILLGIGLAIAFAMIGSTKQSANNTD